jgi:hypothetical protein
MALIAWADNWQADHLVDHPSASMAVEAHLIGAANSRMLFRYQAAEETRRNYELWEMAQIVLGSLFFLFLLFGTNESQVAILAGLLLLVLVLIQTFFLSPNITSQGRELDFVPPAVANPGRAKLVVLLGFYGGVEVAKWLAQFTMASRLILGRRSLESERVRNYVNPINKANYRHINR